MMSDRVGTQLGKYRVDKLLGRGAFAEVYLGYDTFLRRSVALKLPQARSVTEKDRQRFREEAQKMVQLEEHLHVVKILDGFLLGDLPVLVMAYAARGSLRQRYPPGTVLKPTDILPLLTQVADALGYLHEKGLIHRDIKPENLLLSEKEAVWLSDFGITIMQPGTFSTAVEGTAGTILYMAPEQASGAPEPASDQYSLGIVVYEWLTGAPPFMGLPIEVIAQHASAEPPPLRAKAAGLSPELEQVVLRALAKQPGGRFESVRAFAKRFEEVCRAEDPTLPGRRSQPLPYPPPVQVVTPIPSVPLPPPAPQVAGPTMPVLPAGPASGPLASNVPTQPDALRSSISPTLGTVSPGVPTIIPPRKEGGRVSRRGVVIGVSAVVLVTVAGGLAFAFGILPSRSANGHATATPRSSATVGPTDTVAPAATTPPAATSTPGSFPHPAAPYTYGGHTNEVDAVAWSPDGTHIVSGSRDTTAQVWRAEGGSSLLTYSGHSDWVRAAVWSPDSTRIASGSQDTTVQVWDAASGAQKFTYRGHSQVVLAVAWSPDGGLIASGGGDQTVQVWDAVNGNLRNTFRGHTGIVNGVCWSPDSRFVASASDDQTVQVWEALTGRVVTRYTRHAKEVLAVAWSPDGKYVASASKDKTVQLWSALSGDPVLTYQGHADLVLSVAWAFDSRRVASGSADRTAQVWDALTGAHIVTYIKHTNWVHQVSWAPDGTWVVSGSADRHADVWLAM
jgi:serine/threonine protein kinase